MIQALDLNGFKELLDKGYTVIDTRLPEIFADGFIEHSLSIPLNENFAITFSELVEEDQKLLFVVSEDQKENALQVIRYNAITNAEGYLVLDVQAWRNAGHEIDLLITVDADELAMDYQFDEFYLIDTRSDEEYSKDHVEDAENITLADLEGMLTEMEEESAYYVYGNTVADAISAGSVFKRTGFQRVRVVAADYTAIQNTKIPFFAEKKKTPPSSSASKN